MLETKGRETSIRETKKKQLNTPRGESRTLICTIQCRFLFQRTLTPDSAPVHCKTSLFSLPITVAVIL